MAAIDINSLNRIDTVSLSDIFETYTLSDNYEYSQIISFADLSNYFFNVESFSRLSAKYDELLNLFADFKKFMNENYPTTTELSNILATETLLSQVVDSLMTINKVKRDYLDDYCTYDYAEFKKNAAYKYHEQQAISFGYPNRKLLLNMIVSEGLPEEELSD